jgi:hypothetical protein
MSAGQYIDNFDNQRAKERLEEMFKSKAILRLLEDLTRVCNNFYEEDERLPEQNIARGLRAKSNPIDDSVVTKDTFHSQIDALKHEFLDKNDKLSGMEQALIYQFVEFVKSNC